MADPIYDFSHEVGTSSFDITMSTMRMSIRYVGASSSHSETASSSELGMNDIFDGISIRHRLEPYIISSEFEMRTVPDEIEIALTFSSSVTIRNPMPSNPGVISAIDMRGNTILSIIASRMMDDTGMSSPVVEISPSGDGSEWTISISADEAWAGSSSRVSPFRFSLDYSLSPPSRVAMSSIRLASIDNDSILYQDTRPDSATMFAVYFCDDSQFKRERMMTDGKPVCSTIPHIEGDTWDLTQPDFDRHESGYGYDTRRVWLEIIASKAVPVDTPVYYDVIPAGTVQYLGNLAERTGYIGGLPIFRGSFVVTRRSPPSFEDGTGVVRAYIVENRTKDMYAKIRVVGHGVKQRQAVVHVIGTKVLRNTAARVTVLNKRRAIGARVTIVASKGIDHREARVLVHQPNPVDEFVTDGKFDISSTLVTRWTQPSGSAYYGDYTGTVSQVAQPDPGGLDPYPSDAVQFVSKANSPMVAWVDWHNFIGNLEGNWGNVFPGEMSMMVLVDVPMIIGAVASGSSLLLSFRYMHRQLPPPTGYVWKFGSYTGMIGIRANGSSTGGPFIPPYRAWGSSRYTERAGYLHEPSCDEVWYETNFSISNVSGTVSLTNLYIMFVPQWGYARRETYPYDVTPHPGIRMADLYLDNISAKIA